MEVAKVDLIPIWVEALVVVWVDLVVVDSVVAAVEVWVVSKDPEEDNSCDF